LALHGVGDEGFQREIQVYFYIPGPQGLSGMDMVLLSLQFTNCQTGLLFSLSKGKERMHYPKNGQKWRGFILLLALLFFLLVANHLCVLLVNEGVKYWGLQRKMKALYMDMALENYPL